MYCFGIIIKVFFSLDIYMCVYCILEYLIFNKMFDVIIMC